MGASGRTFHTGNCRRKRYRIEGAMHDGKNRAGHSARLLYCQTLFMRSG